uniref:SXP/RAL-2 family protein Ani s 5-like cation-binding domain-containing protein n=1 Tax=Ditylenchus dipsaci TaxID=166011 RepID=A0A915DTU1_9BILA
MIVCSVVHGQSHHKAISNYNSADFQIRHYARAKRYIAVRRTVVAGGNRGYYGGGYPSYYPSYGYYG